MEEYDGDDDDDDDDDVSIVSIVSIVSSGVVAIDFEFLCSFLSFTCSKIDSTIRGNTPPRIKYAMPKSGGTVQLEQKK